jgi:phenylacetate-coenzyme A ligase PaaK-like adenylate-forming protein
MRLSSIEGRENDCVIGEDGERFLATEVSDRLESEFGLRDFQLVQNSLNEFTLLLRADDIERRKEVSGVKEYLEEIAGSPVNLEVRPRSDDDYWVKTRPVVCRVK